jgi:hypothetical protein
MIDREEKDKTDKEDKNTKKTRETAGKEKDEPKIQGGKFKDKLIKGIGDIRNNKDSIGKICVGKNKTNGTIRDSNNR